MLIRLMLVYCMYRPGLLVLIALLIGLPGCVSSGGTGTDGTFRQRIGVAAPADIIRETENTLVSRYGYRFDRKVTTSEDLRFITQWNNHSPLEDEQERGIAQSRTRIFVNARPRSRAGGEVRTYTVIFEAEYQVQKQGNPEWVSVSVPPDRTEYLEDIADYLEGQVASGVRTY